MKPIPTEYKGFLFRSRLEARWAVFFDCMGIDWEYEKEGYEFHDGTRYLPDFWLPQVEMWGEVKPIDLSDDEKYKCKILVRESEYPCLLLIGYPDFVNYDAYQLDPWYYDDQKADELYTIDYSLVTKMIVKGERRFPCGNFCGSPDEYPPEYHEAVKSAKTHQFWRPNNAQTGTIAA